MVLLIQMSVLMSLGNLDTNHGLGLDITDQIEWDKQLLLDYVFPQQEPVEEIVDIIIIAKVLLNIIANVAIRWKLVLKIELIQERHSQLFDQSERHFIRINSYSPGEYAGLQVERYLFRPITDCRLDIV